MAQPLGIRLDFLSKLLEAIKSNKELESILGSPIERHMVLLVEGGKFRFRRLTPFGEAEKPLTAEELSRASEIVDALVMANKPGSESLPEVR